MFLFLSPQPETILNIVREGDVVIVESISRFGRSLPDLIELIDKLNKKGVYFKSLKEGDIDTSSATGKLVFNIFASLAEFERETILIRQKEGIAIAKAQGRYKGRAKVPYDYNKFVNLYDRWQKGEIKKKYICKELHMSPATLGRRINEYRINNKWCQIFNTITHSLCSTPFFNPIKIPKM